MAVPLNPKLYHICHADRLASIVTSGGLMSDVAVQQASMSGTAIGMSNIKQRRMNELQVYTKDAVDPSSNGHRLIPIGPEHPFYGRFTPAKGHGIGFNDLKAIEIARFIEAIAIHDQQVPIQHRRSSIAVLRLVLQPRLPDDFSCRRYGRCALRPEVDIDAITFNDRSR